MRSMVLALVLAATAAAQVTDFAIDTAGPHHVVQGHYLFFSTQGRIIAGTDEPGTVPTISGLPAGATAEFVDMVRNCCGTTLWSLPDGNPVKVSTSSATPTGQYSLTITYTTPEGLQRSAQYTIAVDPVPTLSKQPGPYWPVDVPLTGLQQWTANMTTYGRKHCVATELNNWEGNVWFYDGARTYYQAADATGDSSWNACAAQVLSFYRQWVLSNAGNLQGWDVFPDGLAMSYLRTGEATSRQAVAALAATGYAAWIDVKYIVPWLLSREVSYGVETNLVDQSLGGAPNPHFQDLIEVVLGHFDQWFVSRNSAYVQPFMVALAAEALIRYWDVSHDPRVPPALQTAADGLWRSWDVASQSFLYYNADGTTMVSPDLNLLIAPLYGWVFRQTGAQQYRDEGDQVFNGGVSGAWLDGGKQFSQNYRWSGKYIEWRSLGLSVVVAGSAADHYHQPMVPCRFSGSTVLNPPCAALYSDATVVSSTLLYAVGQPLTYTLPAPAAVCDVAIMAWEPNKTGVGQRVFSIQAGDRSSGPIDLFALAGQKRLYRLILPSVPAVNGQITVQFLPLIGNPVVSSLQLQNCSTPPPAVTGTFSCPVGVTLTIDGGRVTNVACPAP